MNEKPQISDADLSQISLLKSTFATSIMIGHEMKILFANAMMKELLGKGEDVEGKTLLDIMPELENQPFPELMRDVIKTGKTLNINESKAEIVRNGIPETKYFNLIYQPYFQNDSITGVTTIAYDVSEQVLARKKAEENELYFRKLADSMPAKVSNADADGNVIYFNQRWLDYTGKTFDELKAFGYHNIMHPDEIGEFQILLQHAAETGTTIKMEMRFLDKNNEYKWHLNLATPVLDEDGKVKMWIGSTTEMEEQINQKKLLEELVKERTSQLEKANQQLREQNNEKEKRAMELINTNKELVAFNYISSHDLQEPLRKVQTFANRIISEEANNLTEIGKTSLDKILSSTTRMRQLIDDLLAYSRIISSDKFFVKTPLNNIIEEVKTELEEVIIEKEAVISISDLNEINIIPFQFFQLFQNLFTNALKFSSPNRKPEITISSRIDTASFFNIPELSGHENWCEIRFTDNGIGFDAQYKEKVFEVFKRFHGHQEISGTGIGLSIVKKIIENHKGFITVESEVDKGTTFRVYIPV